jgi:hypothetical protein
MIVIAQEISAHERYFRDTGRVPDSPPQKTSDDFDITGWDTFLTSGEQTPLFAPIVRYDGRDVHASNRVFCNFCRRWITYSGSVSHYKNHAELHSRTISGSHTDDDVTMAIYSFVLARGEPLTIFEFLRRTPLRETIPSDCTFKMCGRHYITGSRRKCDRGAQTPFGSISQ